MYCAKTPFRQQQQQQQYVCAAVPPCPSPPLETMACVPRCATEYVAKEVGMPAVNGFAMPAGVDLVALASSTSDFRYVAKTCNHMQLCVQTLKPGTSVSELRQNADTMYIVMGGTGLATAGSSTWDLCPGRSIVIPANTRVQMRNACDKSCLKYIVVYTTPQYIPALVQTMPMSDSPAISYGGRRRSESALRTQQQYSHRGTLPENTPSALPTRLVLRPGSEISI